MEREILLLNEAILVMSYAGRVFYNGTIKIISYYIYGDEATFITDAGEITVNFNDLSEDEEGVYEFINGDLAIIFEKL